MYCPVGRLRDVRLGRHRSVRAEDAAIVRDLGALPEVIQESGGGPHRRGLLAAIGRIAGSPSLRAELGEKGYRAFLRTWSTETHLNRYFSLLRKVATRKFGFVPWEDGSVDPRALP